MRYDGHMSVGGALKKIPRPVAIGAAALGALWLLGGGKKKAPPNGSGGADISGLKVVFVPKDATPEVDAQQIDAGTWQYEYVTKWVLGEGEEQAAQWAQITGAVIGAAGTALAPVAGPIAAQAMATIANIISTLKKKDRWVTSPAGVWQTIAILPYPHAYIEATVKWGRKNYPDSGKVSFSGARDDTGLLVADSSKRLCENWSTPDPACDYVYDGLKEVASNARLIEPPGSRMPELGVVVTGTQTVLGLWIPSRGADAPNNKYLYRVQYNATMM